MGYEKPEYSCDVNSSSPGQTVGGNLGLKVLGREESAHLLDCFLVLSYGEPSTVDCVFGILALASLETELNSSMFSSVVVSKGRRFLGWGRSLSST